MQVNHLGSLKKAYEIRWDCDHAGSNKPINPQLIFMYAWDC